jgi:hypothetical protein
MGDERAGLGAGPNQEAAASAIGAETARRLTMNTNTSESVNAPVFERVDIRHLSSEQLARLGVSQIAYVKPVMMNGMMAYSIHAADGTPMAMAADRDVAIASVQQHEMLASLVH